LEDRGFKPEEAVGKGSRLADFYKVRLELEEHGMRHEAEILESIWRKRFGKPDLNILADVWSKHPPENEGKLAFVLGENNPQEAKKFIEGEIAKREERKEKINKELESLEASVRTAPNQAWVDYWQDEVLEKRIALRNVLQEVVNLKKTHEMLEKHGGALKELLEKAVKERSAQPEALTPAVDVTNLQTWGLLHPTLGKTESMQAEGVKKSIFEIAAREGLSEDNVGKSMRKCNPAKAEKIIEICKNHHFDGWKEHQSVFMCSLKKLDSNLSLAEHNNVDPAQLGLVLPLGYDTGLFRTRLKSEMEKRGLKFREPEAN
jgi:hypothetical protein